jgi:hypothetical protein
MPNEQPSRRASDRELRAVLGAAWIDILRSRHPGVTWVIEPERAQEIDRTSSLDDEPDDVERR